MIDMRRDINGAIYRTADEDVDAETYFALKLNVDDSVVDGVVMALTETIEEDGLPWA